MVNEILFEDNHIIVVNKITGDIVQADRTEDPTLRDTVKDYLKEKYQKPGNVFVGVVHRLDRPVSGAVIFAKTSKALKRLNSIFKAREIKKVYWVVVDKAPPRQEDKLINYLRRNATKNKSYVVDEGTKDAVYAELEYKVLAGSDRYYLLEVLLHTGRHHQIRAQMAGLGCRIKGDLKYGFPRSNPDASIHLHARFIEFIHPVNKEIITITAPLPDDPLWNFFGREMSHKEKLK
ncbi:MAG: RluA family pseudouridine synthase [Bacteroidales bacterium]|nr:RluA family pseudouridine synthase [Bacteroidales bacterium]